MDLTRNDLRRAVLQRLDTFTERVEWIGTGADYAFADSVIEFARWFADCEADRPMTPHRETPHTADPRAEEASA